jgi:hypothetical protein
MITLVNAGSSLGFRAYCGGAVAMRNIVIVKSDESKSG